MTQPPPAWGQPHAWGQPPPTWRGPAPGTIYGTGSLPPAPTTNGLAVAALVTGLFFWCFVIPGIVAVILGYLALEQIADSAGAQRGRGMAIAGIVLGWVGIGLLGIGVLAFLLAVALA